MNKLAFIYLNRKYLGSKIAADLNPAVPPPTVPPPPTNQELNLARQQAIIKQYPRIGIAGTPENKHFVDNYKKTTDYDSLAEKASKISTSGTKPPVPVPPVKPVSKTRGLTPEETQTILKKYPEVGKRWSPANEYFVKGFKEGVTDFEELARIASDPKREFNPGQAKAMNDLAAKGTITGDQGLSAVYGDKWKEVLDNAQKYQKLFSNYAPLQNLSQESLARPFSIDFVSHDELNEGRTDGISAIGDSAAYSDGKIRLDNVLRPSNFLGPKGSWTISDVLNHELGHSITTQMPREDPDRDLDRDPKDPYYSLLESQAKLNQQKLEREYFSTDRYKHRQGETSAQYAARVQEEQEKYRSQTAVNKDIIKKQEEVRRKDHEYKTNHYKRTVFPEVTGLTNSFDRYLFNPHESEVRRAKMAQAWVLMGNKQPATPEEGKNTLAAFGIGAPGQPKPLIKAKAFQFLKENNDVQTLVDAYNKLNPEQQQQVYNKWSGEQGGLVKNENGRLPSTTRPLLQNNTDFQKRMTA